MVDDPSYAHRRELIGCRHVDFKVGSSNHSIMVNDEASWEWITTQNQLYPKPQVVVQIPTKVPSLVIHGCEQKGGL